MASVGVIFAARSAGMSPARTPTPTSSSEAVIASWKSTLGIQEVRQLRAGAAQRECDQLEQAHAHHQAEVAGEARDQRRLQQQRAHDLERRRAERLADADLLGALLHRDDHDVADADDAGRQRAQAHEPDEHIDADEQAGDALHGLGHVEGVDAADVFRRHVVAPLHQLEHLLLQLEAIDALLRTQPDVVDEIAPADTASARW